VTATTSGERIRRRARIGAAVDGRTPLEWTESTCRGCVGCAGRCGLFASGSDDATLWLPSDDVTAPQGSAVQVEVDGRALRRGAMRAYGLAVLLALAGAALGHRLGDNVGALLGLLTGTFLAGRLTKRLDAAPPLCVRPCTESDSNDPKELSR
jgi:hypothetical protein